MTGYEPLNVLKPVVEDLWIVDGPRISFYGAPFPTRMTVIRLGSGDLFLHSPTAPTPELIILAHGRWCAENGVAELRRAFRWAL